MVRTCAYFYGYGLCFIRTCSVNKKKNSDHYQKLDKDRNIYDYIDKSDNVIYNVTDKTIISDLPEKIVLDDFCYLTKAQAALYEKVLSQSMSEISASGGGINRRGAIFKLITNLLIVPLI